jgi:hypothetical protein
LGDLGDVFIVAGDYNLDIVEGYEVSISMLKVAQSQRAFAL